MQKPTLTGSTRYRQGIFAPKNPKKYDGDAKGIIFRSNLEKRFMKVFDEQSSILAWASEELIIQYRTKLDAAEEARSGKIKIRRYFPDFVVKVKDRTGKTRILVIEIKPHSQTIEPKSKGKRYIKEAMDYQKNYDKWMHATAWCRKRGYEFHVLTEKDLSHGF